MKDVYIVAYGRSAVARANKGSFAKVHPIEYAYQVVQGVLDQIPQLPAADIEDLICGTSRPYKECGANVARLIAQRAGLPDSVCGQTVNRFCSSGLQAIATAANCIRSGEGDVYIAGGIEDMTKTFRTDETPYQDAELSRMKPATYISMGLTAENVADQYHVTREEMDQMAFDSHRKAAAAQAAGKFPSIVPVTVKDENGETKVLDKDEGVRPNTNMETLAALKTCFKENGSVTAATSSQMSDAASFVVLMSGEKAAELGIKPIAKFVAFAVAGCDAAIMGMGPAYVVPKLMKRTGLTLEQMDVIEINEAFASQSIACLRELGVKDMDKVNPYGGAMALGHPMGATGAFLTCKALDYLKDNKGKYGLITMCIGGGMGAAGIVELM